MTLDIQAWLLALVCGVAAATLLTYWRTRALWTPWWPVAIPLLYLAGMYALIQTGRLPNVDGRVLPVRFGLLILALSILTATATSWRHRNRR